MSMKLELVDANISEIEAPSDSMIKCTFKYKGKAELGPNKLPKDFIYLNVLQSYGQRFDKDSSSIKKVLLQP